MTLTTCALDDNYNYTTCAYQLLLDSRLYPNRTRTTERKDVGTPEMAQKDHSLESNYHKGLIMEALLRDKRICSYLQVLLVSRRYHTK
jgi:hypothetical protein